MYCIKCGTQLPDGARFCSNCGQVLQTTQSQGTGRDQREAHQLPAGTVLRGRYRVGKVLGQGGFGITYLGTDTLMETQVAIKEFYPGATVFRDCSQTLFVRCHSQQLDAHYQSSKARFLREAKALVKFRDIPEVVDILDFVEENNTAYIIMEYVQGMSLAGYVAAQGGRLSVNETFAILKPVMEALSRVHKADIVHRDIAPDNIILHPLGGAKLLDFGAVRTVEHADADAPLAKSTEAILKHGFAPIEQYNSRGSLGPWTDCYALCATVYYCLTGTIPPEASLRISEGAEPDWSGIPGLTPRQAEALKKGMALRAKDRYPDVDQLLHALFGAEERPTAAPEAAQPEPQPALAAVRPRKTGLVVALGIAAVVIAGAVLFLGLMKGKDRPRQTPAVMPSEAEQTQPVQPAPAETAAAPETMPSPELGESVLLGALFDGSSADSVYIARFRNEQQVFSAHTSVRKTVDQLLALVSQASVQEITSGEYIDAWAEDWFSQEEQIYVGLNFFAQEESSLPQVFVYSDGTVYFMLEEEEHLFAGGEKLFEDLCTLMPREERMTPGTMIPENTYYSVMFETLDWSVEGTPAHNCYNLYDSVQIAELVEALGSVSLRYGQDPAADFMNFKGQEICLHIHEPNTGDTAAYIRISSDGWGEIGAGYDHILFFYDGVALYDLLLQYLPSYG